MNERVLSSARSRWTLALGMAIAVVLSVVVLTQIPDALARGEHARKVERLQTQLRGVDATTARASNRLSDTRSVLAGTLKDVARKQKRLAHERHTLNALDKHVDSLKERISELGG